MKVLIAGILLVLSLNANADITWEGRYRAEYNYFNNVTLDTDSKDKNYLLHHFILTPKIVLADGFEFISTIDVLNNGDYSVSASQAGQSFGSNSKNPSNSYYGADGSVALSDNQIGNVRDVNLREFYLSYKHAAGRLILGRAPLDFGLGINLNSGDGQFDHYFDNRDMIAYEGIFAGFEFKPYIARMTDGFNSSGSAANEFGMMVHWNKEETGLSLGVMGLNRHVQGELNTDQLATTGAANYQRYGLFIERFHKKESNIRYAIELGFNSGKLGQNATGDDIDYSGFGLAFELDYFTPVRGLTVGFKTGYASGADASKNNDFSAFAFDRNYNLGLLLFNHPVGNRNLDLFSTTAYGRQGANFGPGFETNQSIDSESISNTIYASPYLNYQFNPKFNLTTSLIWAQLDQNNVNSPFFSGANSNLKVENDLGLEWDISLSYNPFERMTWETGVGILFPGAAFEGGAQNYETKTIFGGVSRLSISFD